MASQINDGLDGRITVLRTSSVVLHDAAGAERLRLDFLRADAGSRIYAFYDGWSTGVFVSVIIRDLRDDAPFGPRLEFVIKPDEGIEEMMRARCVGTFSKHCKILDLKCRSKCQTIQIDCRHRVLFMSLPLPFQLQWYGFFNWW